MANSALDTERAKEHRWPIGERPPRSRTASGTGSGSPAAFSLIELLVVVAILALLLALLLPSLSRTRARARTAACATRLQQIGRAMNTYLCESGGWIPGSPWTTGHAALFSPAPSTDWNSLALANRLIVDWFDTSTPLRVQMTGARSIPRQRHLMLLLATSDPFACDANPHTSVPFPLGSPGPVIRSISYLSMLSLMRAGAEGYEQSRSFPCMSLGSQPGHVGQSAGWEMSVPHGYRPRIDRLGRESMKVFLADGFRFYDPAQEVYDYDFSGFRCSKGIGNVETPPCVAGSAYNEMYNVARRLAYRHGDNNGINAMMFDGHVRLLTADYRRVSGSSDPCIGFAGEAVHPKYYYPSGTLVARAGFLHLPIPAGTRLP